MTFDILLLNCQNIILIYFECTGTGADGTFTGTDGTGLSFDGTGTGTEGTDSTSTDSYDIGTILSLTEQYRSKRC